VPDEVTGLRQWLDRAVMLGYALATGLVVVACTHLAESASEAFHRPGESDTVGRWLSPGSTIDSDDLAVGGAFTTPPRGILFAIGRPSRRRGLSRSGLVILSIVMAGLPAVALVSTSMSRLLAPPVFTELAALFAPPAGPADGRNPPTVSKRLPVRTSRPGRLDGSRPAAEDA
jgi:hypothetical protein